MKHQTAVPPGRVKVARRAGAVARVEFERGSAGPSLRRQIAEMADRVPTRRELDAMLAGMPEFTRDVLRECARIPKGKVKTYRELAVAVGKPGAARAVGQVMALNPVPLLIPCHRVVRSGGYLGGFGGGLEWKEFLLAREGWELEGTGAKRRLKQKGKRIG